MIYGGFLAKYKFSQICSPSEVAVDNLKFLNFFEKSTSDPWKIDFPHKGKLNSKSKDAIDTGGFSIVVRTWSMDYGAYVYYKICPKMSV